MKRAHVVWSVLIRAIPAETGNCWMASLTSLVMSVTSVPSSLLSVNELLKTFIRSLPGHHLVFASGSASGAASRPPATIRVPSRECQPTPLLDPGGHGGRRLTTGDRGRPP